MNPCNHEHATEGPERGYEHPVAATWEDQDGRAHGGITYTETCQECEAKRAVNASQGFREYGPWMPPAPTEDDLCQECGADIRTGYSWEGLCVVCAERYHNPERAGFTS